MEAKKQNIAHNRALCENVMMMVVCINLRIPLFLIGKPGSSKSLAKTIISNSMRGTSNKLLKNFKEVSAKFVMYIHSASYMAPCLHCVVL